MNIVQKLILVLTILISCQLKLTASSFSFPINSLVDTLPDPITEYKGNRIMVKSIKVLKKKGKSYKIEYKLVNTGRNKIKLGKPINIPKDLIINFDNSLKENDLIGAKPFIIESIKKQKITIRPGQLMMGNKLKFSLKPIPPSDRIAIDTTTQKKEDEITKLPNENPQVPEKDNVDFDDIVKEIVEEVPLPNNELESPRTPSASSPTDSIQLTETTLVNVRPSSTSSEVTIQNENEEDDKKPEKKCADLVLEDVEIVKKNKRFVQVKYTIKNIGNAPISLHGASKKEIDNIALESYFTRSHNLTRGSIPVNIKFIKKGKKDVMGNLVPGESITQKLKVETSKVTRFTPVLALALNPNSTIFECDRVNNVFFIDIAEKAPEFKNPKVIKSKDKKEEIEKITTLDQK